MTSKMTRTAMHRTHKPLFCFALALLFVTPLEVTAGKLRFRLGIASSRIWWDKSLGKSPLFSRVGLSGGIGYDIATIGPFTLEPQFLVSQKDGYEILNHRFPMEAFEVIRRYRYLDLPLLVRMTPKKSSVFFTAGPQLSIPLRLEDEVRMLHQGSDTADVTSDKTRFGHLVFSAVGGLGYQWHAFDHMAFIEFRAEQGLTPAFGPPTEEGIYILTLSLFAGLAF